MGILDDITEDKEYADHMQRRVPKLERDIVGYQTLLTFYKTTLVPCALFGLLPILGAGFSVFSAFAAGTAPQVLSGIKSQKVMAYKVLTYRGGFGFAGFVGGYIAYFIGFAILRDITDDTGLSILLLEAWMVFNLTYTFKHQKRAKIAAKATQVGLEQIDKL